MGGGWVRGCPENTQEEEDVSGVGIGGCGREDLGIRKEMGDLRGDRPEPVAEVEGAATLKAGLRG